MRLSKVGIHQKMRQAIKGLPLLKNIRAAHETTCMEMVPCWPPRTF